MRNTDMTHTRDARVNWYEKKISSNKSHRLSHCPMVKRILYFLRGGDSLAAAAAAKICIYSLPSRRHPLSRAIKLDCAWERYIPHSKSNKNVGGGPALWRRQRCRLSQVLMTVCSLIYEIIYNPMQGWWYCKMSVDAMDNSLELD